MAFLMSEEKYLKGSFFFFPPLNLKLVVFFSIISALSQYLRLLFFLVAF